MDILGSWRVQLFSPPCSGCDSKRRWGVGSRVLSASEDQAEEAQRVGRGLCGAKAKTGLWVPRPVVCSDCATPGTYSLGFSVLLRHYRVGGCGVER